MYLKDDVIKIIRKLAKSNYYQNLYYHVKENGFKLFRNDSDLTELQMHFLNYLEFYSALYLDYSLGEIDDIVFEHDVYEDAYYEYRTKMKRSNINHKEEPREDSQKEMQMTSRWVFKSPKKR